MSKAKWLSMWNSVENFTKQKSPEILTGLTIVGVFTTGIAAFKAGPKAEKILAEKKKDLHDIHPGDKEAKRTVMWETVKELTPVVAPPLVIGGATIGCALGSHNISSRRIAVLSAAYAISENAVKDLNTKMTEVLGEKKARSIKDAIVQDKVGDSPKIDGSQIIVAGSGNVLCKDLYSGRFFHSNAQKIGQAVNELSYDIQSDMYVSLNEFYDKINSPDLERLPMGDQFGWNIDDTIRGKVPITISAVLTNDGVPCLCMDYDVYPRSDYRNLH